MIAKSLRSMIVHNLSSKQVNAYQGDSFSSMVAQMGIINLAMAGTRIGGANFLHCWVTDSI